MLPKAKQRQSEKLRQPDDPDPLLTLGRDSASPLATQSQPRLHTPPSLIARPSFVITSVCRY